MSKTIMIILLFSLNTFAGEYCDKVKSELSAISTLQNEQTINNKTMAELRNEHLELLKQRVFLNGIQALIKNYKQSSEKFTQELDSITPNFAILANTANEVVVATKELELVHDFIDTEAHGPMNFSLPIMISKIEKYEQDNCKSQKVDPFQKLINQLNINPKENFTPVPAKAHECEMIAGLKNSLGLLKNNKQSLHELMKKAEAEIKKVFKDEKQVMALASEIKQNFGSISKDMNRCLSKVPDSKTIQQKDSKLACITDMKTKVKARDEEIRGKWWQRGSLNPLRPVVVPAASHSEANTLRLKQEASKLYNSQEKLIKQELFDIFKANGGDEVSDNEFAKNAHTLFTELYAKKCTKGQEINDCLKNLKAKNVEEELSEVNSKMQKIQDQMEDLTDQDLFEELRKIKMAIISKFKSSCLGGPIKVFECSNKKLGTFGNFLKFGSALVIEVQDPGFLKHGVVSPGAKISNICTANKKIRMAAPSLCKEEMHKVAIAQEYETKHIYVHKGKKYSSARESNSSIAFTAFAKTAVKGIPEFLALDNMRYQNNYIYEQGVMQKNMNYMTQQQNDWYMQNYSLYGTDPYSLGYDPFYSNTFQFGNPNFALYNGYYSY